LTATSIKYETGTTEKEKKIEGSDYASSNIDRYGNSHKYLFTYIYTSHIKVENK